MSIGANTPNNMMLAAGATVTVGGTDIGAMIGETTFTIDVERYFPELFGAKGDVKGTGYIIRAVPRMTTVMAETSYFQLSTLLDQLGSGSSSGTKYYGSGTLGQIASGDYVAVVATGMETCGNKSVKITILYAYVSSAVNITLADDAISQYEVEFTGAYDPVDADKLPCKIEIEE